MAFKIPAKTTFAAALAATFFSGASMVAMAADPMPTGSSYRSPSASAGMSATGGAATSDGSAMRSGNMDPAPGGADMAGTRSGATAGMSGTGGAAADSQTGVRSGAMNRNSNSYGDRSSSSSMGATGSATSGMSGGSSSAYGSSSSAYGSSSYGDSGSMSSSNSMHSGSMHKQRSTSMRTGRGDPQGDRGVTALNLLMAQGYEDYANFRADGSDFVADATRDGRTMRVRIDPESRQITPIGG